MVSRMKSSFMKESVPATHGGKSRALGGQPANSTYTNHTRMAGSRSPSDKVGGRLGAAWVMVALIPMEASSWKGKTNFKRWLYDTGVRGGEAGRDVWERLKLGLGQSGFWCGAGFYERGLVFWYTSSPVRTRQRIWERQTGWRIGSVVRAGSAAMNREGSDRRKRRSGSRSRCIQKE
ncbi:hypothetical protein BDN71DRAFT_1429276 [Pleurotus eryngii]|uniref:Uncharacterized protein n=1 Tax=Pleurotus eryngii TaxID=5323 RepID=A0A9P6A442_PLEER|nr:hypothetical protein BDN71DRAFT_1429276 [Pleurotus eryngii]